MSRNPPVLDVNGLTVEFNGVRVVNDASFQVLAGQTVALVGESGSGKTVTGLSIMRLLDYDDTARITAGSVVLHRSEKDQVDLLRLSLREMRQFRGKEVTMIFQEPLTCLNPAYSIGEQIAESVRIHLGLGRKAAWQRAVQIMDTVRIPDAARRASEYPHQMSGGMRQRVMIAMAMACEPRVLIADEPTTALDVTVQAQVLTLLAELQDEFGMGIIFVTHDMAIVGEIADEIVVMRRSQVVERGSTEKIFAQPQHPYTRALLAAVPRLGSMAGTVSPAKFVLAPEAPI